MRQIIVETYGKTSTNEKTYCSFNATKVKIFSLGPVRLKIENR